MKKKGIIFKTVLAVLAAALLFTACGDDEESSNVTTNTNESVKLDIEVSSDSTVTLERHTDTEDSAVKLLNSDNEVVFRGGLLTSSDYEQYVGYFENSGEDLKTDTTTDGVEFTYYTTTTDSGTETYCLIYFEDQEAGIIGSSTEDEATALAAFKSIKEE